MRNAQVRLRPTAECDVAGVLSMEEAAAKEGYVWQWTREQHVKAIRGASLVHRLVASEDDPGPVGYLILAHSGNPDRSIHMIRLVIEAKGRGYGRAALRLVEELAFCRMGAHRLWLDVFEGNWPARSLCASEGFIAEGTLRECVLRNGEFDSLVLLSMLEGVYNSRRIQEVARNREPALNDVNNGYGG